MQRRKLQHVNYIQFQKIPHGGSTSFMAMQYVQYAVCTTNADIAKLSYFIKDLDLTYLEYLPYNIVRYFS